MNEDVLRQAALNHKTDIIKPFDAIMDVVGFDSVYALCNYFGGTSVYIPQPRFIFHRCLELEAINEYNGRNCKALAHKYGMSEPHLRKLVNNARNNNRVYSVS